MFTFLSSRGCTCHCDLGKATEFWLETVSGGVNDSGAVGQGEGGGTDGVGVWMCAHGCVYVCQNVGVCDNTCVCVSCALSLYMVRSLLIGPFVGVRLGSSDACYRRGVWEPTGRCREDGGGGKG